MHTPGPWQSQDVFGGHAILNARGDMRIATIEFGQVADPANARLIASAPDLLAACEEAREWVRVLALRFGPDDAASKRGCAAFAAQLDAAIAKARQS